MNKNLKWIILLICLVACNVQESAVEIQQADKAETKTQPITIRNVTKEIVYYTIESDRSTAPPQEKTLAINGLDSYPGEESLTLSFKRGEETISYLLDPSTPYSFRYDENDELELYEGSHGRMDAVDLAPYVPTPPSVVEKMLELARVDKDDILYDLGCGDGRIVIMAAKKFGTRGIGIDLDSQRIAESKANAKAVNVDNLVEFRQEDVTKADFSKATVVTLYLLTESNELLRPYLEEQLAPGTYVVSHNYRIPGWELKFIEEASITAEDGDVHNIYVYRK